MLWTPRNARQCARSVSYPEENEGRSLRSSRPTPCVSARSVTQRGAGGVRSRSHRGLSPRVAQARRRSAHAGRWRGALPVGVQRARRAPQAREAAGDGAGYPKNSDGLLRQRDDLKFTFVAEEKAYFPINALCQVLGISRSGFYAWCKRPRSARSKQEARLAVEVRVLHERSRGTYGSPRVFRDLRANGIFTSKQRVARLMRANRIAAKRRRRCKATTDS
ncbi:MAG: transposase, partial [Burkholderiales bacterium]